MEIAVAIICAEAPAVAADPIEKACSIIVLQAEAPPGTKGTGVGATGNIPIGMALIRADMIVAAASEAFAAWSIEKAAEMAGFRMGTAAPIGIKRPALSHDFECVDVEPQVGGPQGRRPGTWSPIDVKH
jgi:hypothetical protein